MIFQRLLAGAAVFAVACLAAAGAAGQSGSPIKIGSSMAMTGGLGPNGKSALLARKIWEEEVNAKGGLLGRPVKLIYYDDQSQSLDRAGHLRQAPRRRQSRPRGRRLRDRDARAGNAGRHAVQEGVHRPARPRGEQRIPLPELLRDDPVGPRSEAGVHAGLLRGRDGAEPEADDRGDRRRRPGILPQRLGRRPRRTPRSTA